MATKKNGNGASLTTPRPSGPPPDLKQSPEVGAEAIELAIRTRFNPIRGLTPQLLAQYLDQYNLGWIAYAELLWDMMERRDDTLKNVAGKRKKDAARLEWQIVKLDNSTEAGLHQEALQTFYDNVTAINALDENEKGGFQLLVRQMMDAVGKKYAVHEIVWQPGERFTAEFRFVPMWFFENRTGKLQVLSIPLGGAYGTPLEEGGWMVTVGDGLMEACSVAYMFKHLPLKDWLAYSDKFGTPGVLGQTNAAKESEAGKAMKDAVTNFGQNWSAVIYGADGSVKEPIQLVQAGGSTRNNMPFPALIERMDRAMISLWRGADLSTMSRGGGERSIGASVQEEEADILLRDDADTISETLNMYVDRYVLWQLFGVEHGLAYIELKAPETTDVLNDLKVDELLLNAGARMGERERLQYYGRPQYDPKDIALHSPAKVTERITPQTKPGDANDETKKTETLPNVSTDRDLEKYLGVHRGAFLAAFANDLLPLRTAIEHAVADPDPTTQNAHLVALKAQLPQILRHVDEKGTAAEVLSVILANSLKVGLERAKQQSKAK